LTVGSSLPVSFSDILAASDRIRPYVHRTPIARSRSLDRMLGAELWFKCENLQKVGAFKARGATNAVMAMDAESIRRGFIAHSSGNHGQAVAFAAALRGVPAYIVMPDGASPVKREAVIGYGAEVITCTEGHREETAAAVAERTGASLIHPFDDPVVIAGQATAALELLTDVPDLDVVLTPIGGGGLLSGTAVACATMAPSTAVVGAEPETVDDAFRSLASGIRQPRLPGTSSIADGLLTGIGALPFEILTSLGTSIVCVDETAIVEAARLFLQRTKLLIEPSAATTIAALRTQPTRFDGKRVGVIISGGNTDLAWLQPVASGQRR